MSDDITLEDAAISLNIIKDIVIGIDKNIPKFLLYFDYIKTTIITLVFLMVLPMIIIGLLIFILLAALAKVKWWIILIVSILIILIGLGFAGIVLAVIQTRLSIYENKLLNQFVLFRNSIKDGTFVNKITTDVGKQFLTDIQKVYLFKDAVSEF
jgi:hypothetical protein